MQSPTVHGRVLWLALVAAALAGVPTPVFSQCTNTSSFGTATISSVGAVVTITTCAFAGEYSTVNGAVNGQNLTFTSNIPTDFITIHSGTFNGPVVAFGTTPLSFANTFTGTLFAHWNTNAACGTESACRTGTVQCTNCAPPPAPPNDACASAIAIGSPSTTPGTTLGAAADTAPTCGTTLNTAPGVWYSFTPCASGSFTASLCGASYDTKIGVFTGGCGGLTCVAGNDDSNACGTGSLQSQVSFAGTGGTTYLILVTGFSTNSGAFTLNMTGSDLCGSCTLGCPGTQTVGTATDSCVATVNYPAPTVTGNCGNVTCTPPSGGTFNLGTTPVACTSELNGGACGFDVVVNDTQPPTVDTPDVSVGTDAGVCTAVVNFGAIVSDNCPGVAAAICTPASGTTFALGATAVTCSTTDAAGNPGSDPGTVTVNDDEDPVLAACPADLFVPIPPGAQSTTVDFAEPTMTDNCSPAGVATCVPAPGDIFPIGTTAVACTASDGAGNDATCAFDVAVGNQALQEIPTASTLGLLALALLLGGAAFVALRRGA
jgi:hypothetical protein